MSDTPSGKVKVRMYRVGFGDCFLLSFGYKNSRDRHVLIDAGVLRQTTKALRAAVDAVAGVCDKLDAIVFTHRHADHLVAIGDETAGGKLLGLNSGPILLPWTEDPRAQRNAKEPSQAYTDEDREFLESLDLGQDLEDAIEGNKDAFREHGYTKGMSNKPALGTLARHRKKCRYLAAGRHDKFRYILPGIKVRVLGPPTLKDWPQLRIPQHSKYWKLRLGLAQVRARQASPAEENSFGWAVFNPEDAPTPARWFIERLEQVERDNMLRLVTSVRNAINNTSLVLLFEVGGAKLLFAGDAEHAAWDFILKDEATRKSLADIRLYKVSHHGSGNGTPKKLFWEKLKNLKTNKQAPGRLITLLSGEREANWEDIPAPTLHKALRKKTTMHSTYEEDNQQGPWEVDLP